MSRIHFLPVKNGDSFVIECDKGNQHGVVVVDGGPTGYGKVLQSKVEETGIPDLLVLTHYDEDHIGGLTQYINSCVAKGESPAKEVWANCAGYVEVEEPVMTKSIVQGVKLSELLNRESRMRGMAWRDDVVEGIDKDFPFASIEVVSPTPEVRELVIQKQKEEGLKQQAKAKSLDKEAVVEVDDLTIPLEILAKGAVKAPNLKKSNELANAASIAFILRCDGLSILMLGDGYPHNVEAYLRKKGYSEDNPLEVDFVKVAHHGSMNNTSNELLDIIKCNRFIIPTNGEKHGHPDRAAIAHILCHPGRDRQEKVHLYFNCGLDVITGYRGKPFVNDGEQETWNFEIHDNVTELFTQAPEPALQLDQKPEPGQEPELEQKSEPQPPVTPAPAKRSWKRYIIWIALALALAIAVLAFCLCR